MESDRLIVFTSSLCADVLVDIATKPILGFRKKTDELTDSDWIGIDW